MARTIQLDVVVNDQGAVDSLRRVDDAVTQLNRDGASSAEGVGKAEKAINALGQAAQAAQAAKRKKK